MRFRDYSGVRGLESLSSGIAVPDPASPKNILVLRNLKELYEEGKIILSEALKASSRRYKIHLAN